MASTHQQKSTTEAIIIIDDEDEDCSINHDVEIICTNNPPIIVIDIEDYEKAKADKLKSDKELWNFVRTIWKNLLIDNKLTNALESKQATKFCQHSELIKLHTHLPKITDETLWTYVLKQYYRLSWLYGEVSIFTLIAFICYF